MSTWLLTASLNTGFVQNDNYKFAYALCGILDSVSGGGAEEPIVQLLIRDTYTLANCYIRILANTLTNAATLRSRVDAGNGNIAISLTALTSGVFEDAVNSDNLTTGELVNTEIDAPSGGTSITISLISYTLTSDNDVPILMAFPPSNSFNDGYLRFSPVGGDGTDSDTETERQITMRAATTLSNLSVYHDNNAVDQATTVRLRVNGADGNQVISIPNWLPEGLTEDAVNTDAINVGDEVCWEIDVTASTSGSISILNIHCKSSSTGRQIMAGYGWIPSNLTLYNTVEGRFACIATEADTQCTARCAFTARNMCLNLYQNSLDGTSSVFTLRKNGADTTLTISVPNGTTGIFEDLVHSVAFIATDLLNWKLVTDGSSGNIEFSFVSFQLDQPAAPPPGAPAGGSVAGKMIAGELI